MKTAEIKAALSARYSAPEHAIFYEVGNATGFDCKRHADAVAMSLWPSRGLELMGIEIKASRSDWKRELENPAKAEAVYKFMDRWWIVAGDEKIVHDGELPPTWGLIVARGERLVTKVEAPKLEAKPVTRTFLAALLRRAHEVTDKPKQAELKKQYDDGYRLGHDSGLALGRRELAELRGSVNAFELASEIKIGTWDGGRIGTAVKRVLAGDHLRPKVEIERLRRSAQAILAQCDEALSLEEAPSDPATA